MLIANDKSKPIKNFLTVPYMDCNKQFIKKLYNE